MIFQPKKKFGVQNYAPPSEKNVLPAPEEKRTVTGLGWKNGYPLILQHFWAYEDIYTAMTDQDYSTYARTISALANHIHNLRHDENFLLSLNVNDISLLAYLNVNGEV